MKRREWLKLLIAVPAASATALACTENTLFTRKNPTKGLVLVGIAGHNIPQGSYIYYKAEREYQP